jgi:hypothetical protein
MVTKKTRTGEQETKRGKATVGKLKLNKETVMDLSPTEQKRVKGGAADQKTVGVTTISGTACPTGFCSIIHGTCR